MAAFASVLSPHDWVRNVCVSFDPPLRLAASAGPLATGARYDTWELAPSPDEAYLLHIASQERASGDAAAARAFPHVPFAAAASLTPLDAIDVCLGACDSKSGARSGLWLFADTSAKCATLQPLSAGSGDGAQTSPTRWRCLRFSGGGIAVYTTAAASAPSCRAGADGAPVEATRYFLTDDGALLPVPSTSDDIPGFLLHLRHPPVVSVAPLLTPVSEANLTRVEAHARARCVSALRRAACDCGFFFLRDHGVTAAAPLLAAATRACTDARLARFTKATLASSTGLVKVSFNPPVHEPIDVPPWLAGDVHEPFDSRAVASQNASATSETLVGAYFRQGCSLGTVVLEALTAVAAVPSGRFYSLLRCVCYPPAEGEAISSSSAHGGEGASVEKGATTTAATTAAIAARGLSVHTDKSWLTVLVASSLDGLQMSDADGDAYCSLVRPGGPASSEDPTEPWLLLNVGDALEIFSEGLYVSRPHRALNLDATHPRVSLPLFLEPHPECWPSRQSQATSQQFALVEL